MQNIPKYTYIFMYSTLKRNKVAFLLTGYAYTVYTSTFHL